MDKVRIPVPHGMLACVRESIKKYGIGSSNYFDYEGNERSAPCCLIGHVATCMADGDMSGASTWRAENACQDSEVTSKNDKAVLMLRRSFDGKTTLEEYESVVELYEIGDPLTEVSGILS